MLSRQFGLQKASSHEPPPFRQVGTEERSESEKTAEDGRRFRIIRNSK